MWPEPHAHFAQIYLGTTLGHLALVVPGTLLTPLTAWSTPQGRDVSSASGSSGSGYRRVITDVLRHPTFFCIWFICFWLADEHMRVLSGRNAGQELPEHLGPRRSVPLGPMPGVPMPLSSPAELRVGPTTASTDSWADSWAVSIRADQEAPGSFQTANFSGIGTLSPSLKLKTFDRISSLIHTFDDLTFDDFIFDDLIFDDLTKEETNFLLSDEASLADSTSADFPETSQVLTPSEFLAFETVLRACDVRAKEAEQCNMFCIEEAVDSLSPSWPFAPRRRWDAGSKVSLCPWLLLNLFLNLAFTETCHRDLSPRPVTETTLATADVSGLELDLIGDDLTNADLSGSKITTPGSYYSDGTIDFNEADLTDANLSGSKITASGSYYSDGTIDFTEADLTNADLSGSEITAAHV